MNSEEAFLNSIVEKTEFYVSASIGGEEAVLHTKTGMYYALNPIASNIWSCIYRPQAVYQIVDCLISDYEVEKEECLMAVLEFLHDLEKYELIIIRRK